MSLRRKQILYEQFLKAIKAAAIKLIKPYLNQ